jgi:CxxC motif-containing protein (DUF1111 family)
MSRRIGTSQNRHFWTRPALLGGAFLLGVTVLGVGGLRAADTGKPSADQQVLGRALFEREWLPGDSRTHGGDGLGPVYNDSSCIACHNLGGNGGGGPASKNVDIVTASPSSLMVQDTGDGQPGGTPSFLGKALGSLVGIEPPDTSRTKPSSSHPAARKPAARRKIDNGPLVKAHPGFRTSRSIVLHRFGTESGYEAWRQSMMGLGQVNPPGMDDGLKAMAEAQLAANTSRQQFMQNTIGQFELVRSQRNPTALFGAGLIDAIPDRVIEDAARAKHPGLPEIAGRVSRLKDQRIGRFGWKAQTASLEDFVLTACAVELGLEVPGHHQGGNPQKPEAHAQGLDLSAQECNALVDYIRALPKPTDRMPATAAETREVAAGRELFVSTGCATCHAPKLGSVDGLYSDLLLHDLGQQLGDTGQYGVFDPSSSEEEITDDEGPIADVTPGAPAEVMIATPTSPLVREAVVAEATVTSRRAMPATTTRPATGPASRFEWRTAPLWGFRDSGPYLHDGRADTIDQAVALHGGEAMNITGKYFGLSFRERRHVETFLKSLTAPDPVSPERVASVR